MGHKFTRVPTTWSPLRTYQLTGWSWLVPAGRVQQPGVPQKGSLDQVFYVTEGITEHEHREALGSWAGFHGFFLADDQPLTFLQQGGPRTWSAPSLDAIRADLAGLRHPLDFDHIGRQVYWPLVGAPDVSYRSAFGAYCAAPPDQRAAAVNLLLSFARPGDRTPGAREGHYWQLLKDLSIVDAALGAPPSRQAVGLRCEVRGGMATLHRDEGEGFLQVWRAKQLEHLIRDEQTRQQYAGLIEAATSTTWLRSAPDGDRTVAGPSREDTLEQRGRGAPSSDRGRDPEALDSLLWGIRSVARFLLLHRLIGARCFPPILSVDRSTAGIMDLHVAAHPRPDPAGVRGDAAHDRGQSRGQPVGPAAVTSR